MSSQKNTHKPLRVIEQPATIFESKAAEDEEADMSNKLPTGLTKELGGRDGPEPTRFGDWEKNGRCIDF